LMAKGALEKTPEANVALAVTGHLGPNAPPQLDGLVFAAVAWREDGRHQTVTIKRLRCERGDSRVKRQSWAAEQVLELLGDELQRARDDATGRTT
jgi:nicotinamide-nucleotide amidase